MDYIYYIILLYYIALYIYIYMYIYIYHIYYIYIIYIYIYNIYIYILFKENGLSLETECNLKTVYYLDITLDLNTGTYKPSLYIYMY